MDEELRGGGIREMQNSVDLGDSGNCENLSNSSHQSVSETVVVIRSAEEGVAPSRSENGSSNAAANTLGSSKVPADGSKVKALKDDEQYCVIDMKNDANGKLEENSDAERVCRICHLSSDPSLETPPRTTATATTILTTITTATTPPPTTTINGLMQLGCGCKDELGMVHALCAESWFKLKGNRQCEICGETAKNVTGIVDTRFMEWNETRSAGSGSNLSERGGGCWRGQPFCNFLMSCLVIAFVLPWFLRVNMF